MPSFVFLVFHKALSFYNFASKRVDLEAPKDVLPDKAPLKYLHNIALLTIFVEFKL